MVVPHVELHFATDWVRQGSSEQSSGQDDFSCRNIKLSSHDLSNLSDLFFRHLRGQFEAGATLVTGWVIWRAHVFRSAAYCNTAPGASCLTQATAISGATIFIRFSIVFDDLLRQFIEG